MSTWFDDPKNQAALAQLVDALRVHSEILNAARAAADDSEER